MKGLFKKLSVYASAVMLIIAFNFIAAPLTVHAETPESVKVYLTSSVSGTIYKDKNGNPMANRELIVTDLDKNGKISFNEALYLAHELYAPNGVYDYGCTPGSYGSGWVTQLWGISNNGWYYFFANNKAIQVGVGGHEIHDNDHLYTMDFHSSTGGGYNDVPLFWRDENDNDIFIKTARVNKEITLKIFMGKTWEEGAEAASAENIDICTWQNGAAIPLTSPNSPKLDSNNMIKVRFADRGTYVLTAAGEVTLVSGSNPPKAKIDAPACTLNIVDGEALNLSIQAAYDAFDNIAESADGSDVLPDNQWTSAEARNNLYNAIDAAKQIYDNEDSSQEEIDNGVNTLEASVNEFKALIKPGTKAPAADEPEVNPNENKPLKTKPTTNQSAKLDNVEYAPVYNYDYYINNNPDVKAAFNGDKKAALNHFVNYGMNEGRRGCEWFDISFYKNSYRDLKRAFGDDNKSYYMHYINYGRNEGRRGCEGNVSSPYMPVVANDIDYSSVYNYDYYINNNPDIKAAFKGNRNAALNHFINYGMSEGRRGCEWFDVGSYKNAYSDLRAAYKGDLKAYYMHYINYGANEGRNAVDVSEIVGPTSAANGVDYSPIYDYSFYLENNPDVKAAFGGDEEAVLNHFVKYGMAEGRVANSEFNVWIYKANYGDLQAAFNDDFKSYYMHYINCGISEGRSGK